MPAERVSQRGEGRDPEQRARAVVEHELPDWNAQHAGERRRDHLEAGDELGDDQNRSLPAREDIFGALHARVGLERNLADEAEDALAAPTTELVPDQIGRQQRGERPDEDAPERQPARTRQHARRDEDGRSRHRHTEAAQEHQPQHQPEPVCCNECLRVDHTCCLDARRSRMISPKMR